MDEVRREIAFDYPPLVRVYTDGHVHRFASDEPIPAGTDPQTGVSSKDVTIISDCGVYVRLYLPDLTDAAAGQKLPLLVYFHGGGFCISTPATPPYHDYLNKLASQANIVAISVHYRRPPENPLPAAYQDSMAALRWALSHRNADGPEAWLNRHADFGRVFLAGDSAGGNIAHNVAMAAGSGPSAQILGLALVHPFFWGADPIGSENLNPDRKDSMDRLWPFVCPSSPDNDDPRINPVAEGAPSLAGLLCRRVLVCVAEKDVLRDRGWVYYEAVGRSGWAGVVEIHETKGEDHAFHLYDLERDGAKELTRRLAAFFNEGMPPVI